MRKTTVHLPEELVVQLDGSAEAAGVSKAEAIRIARTHVEERAQRRLPVFSSGRLRTAEEMDEQIVEHIAERAARR